MRRLASFILFFLLPCLSFRAETPRYQARPELQGLVRIKGSDSMDPLLRLWVEEFQKRQPGVQFQVESHGSATAPPALASDEADLGPMSRPMNAAELEAFVSRKGHEPTGVVVAYDALAVFVNRANPLKRLSIAQLDAIYSRTRKAGWEENLERWGDLYLSKPLKRMEIHPYTRDELSGSRAFFQEQVLQKEGVMRASAIVRDQLGILEGVAQDVAAIGYGPTSYANPEVRVVPVAGLRSGKALLPTPETIQDGSYALSRRLFLYLDRPPSGTLPAPLAAFLDFVLSREGQELVSRYGSVPLAAEDLATARERTK